MAELEDLHPNLLTDLSLFTPKIELQNPSVSVDFIGFGHNSSLRPCLHKSEYASHLH